jgi:hypothetical protein
MTIAVSHEFQPLKDPHQKALHINLDASRYGAFAEIGAGQEIVSLFFHVGGASGTVAKSMSAYDMTVSDSIYGRTGRYVSKERLIAMLDHEYKLLIERLDASRGASTGFFAVADTVAARNYAGTNECHGWMGIRFQSTPKSEPSQILIHVHMMDPDNVRQQEALGLIGVNLTYGAFYLSHDMNLFLEHLLDGITSKRLEVDYVELSGPAFADVDHKLLTVSLLRKGLASAILFDVDQRPIPPTEFFHKRPILLERGSFRALHHIFPDLVGSCKNQLKAAAGGRDQDAVYVLELTLNNILRAQQSTDDEVLTVVEQLCKFGHNILVSNYSEFFRLTEYLRRFSKSPIGFIVSANLLPLLLEDERYKLLEGGVLEASARLFQQNVRLLTYPVESSLFTFYLELIKFKVDQISYPHQGMVTAANLSLNNVNQHLLKYLVESGIVIDVPVREVVAPTPA